MELVKRVRSFCGPAGLDLIVPFDVSWYNAAVREDLRLPTYGRERCLGVLVGNTRALWAPFVEAVRRDPSIAARANPLDEHVAELLKRGLEGAGWPAHELRLANEVAPGRLVHMQKLAHVSGLAFFDESMYLCVHATHGPWIALRAAIIFDAEGPSGPPPAPSCPLSEEAREAAKAALQAALAARAAGRGDWRLFVAVREACRGPFDPAARYCEDQTAYHYSKDRAILLRAAAAAAAAAAAPAPDGLELKA
eukprot:tig00021035_g17246.t1